MHSAMKGNPRHINVTLATINHGEAVEKFDLALEDVLKDLVDPNKDPDAERAITLTVKLQPKKKKGGHRYGPTNVTISCKAKFGPYQETEESMILSEGVDGPEAHQDVYVEGDLDSYFQGQKDRQEADA